MKFNKYFSKEFFIFVYGSFFLIMSTAHARVGPGKLDSLIQDSELIVIAVPSSPREFGSGKDKYTHSASLRVSEVLKGVGQSIEVVWTDIPEDQTPETDVLYLCFLKKIVGSKAFNATHMGYSYWPILKTPGRKAEQAIKCGDPITMEDCKDHAQLLLQETKSKYELSVTHDKWVILEKLKEYIKQVLHK